MWAVCVHGEKSWTSRRLSRTLSMHSIALCLSTCKMEIRVLPSYGYACSGTLLHITGSQGRYLRQLMALTLCVFGREFSESTVLVVEVASATSISQIASIDPDTQIRDKIAAFIKGPIRVLSAVRRQLVVEKGIGVLEPTSTGLRPVHSHINKDPWGMPTTYPLISSRLSSNHCTEATLWLLLS